MTTFILVVGFFAVFVVYGLGAASAEKKPTPTTGIHSFEQVCALPDAQYHVNGCP